MTLAISGASGQLGRIAAESLLGQVDPSQVVLLTRSPEKLADFAARGADVRQADFDDLAGLQTALAGVDRLLLISTDTVGSRLEQQNAAIDTAKAAGVQHVLYTSVPEPVDGNPALVVADHRGTEEHLAASGLKYTYLRNNLYPELSLGGWAAAIAHGQLHTNVGDGGVAYVTREDCALAAAAALAKGAEYEDRVLTITGPEAVTAAGIAERLTALSGQPVEVVTLTDEQYTGGLTSAGVPDFLVPILVSFGAAAREGYLADVTTDVADLIGREPTSLAAVFETAKAELVPAGAAA